nr:hypothetical protein [Tanacetum cinerariifolium]
MFSETHNLIAFLEKPTESDGFEQIIDFLNANHIKKHKSKRKQRKETKVSQDQPPTEEHITTPSHDPLSSGEDKLQLNELMKIYTKLSDRILSLEQINTNQAAEIEKLKKRVKKLEGMKKKKRTHGLKRLYKVGLSARVESFEEEEGLGDQEDASKQGRIAEIDADEDLSLINKTVQDQGRMNEEDLFGVHDLDGDELILDITAGENVGQDATVAEKEVSTAADEVVTSADDAEITTAATTSQISKDDAKEKGKGNMVEPEKHLKKKDQIAIDEELQRKLEAQMKAEMGEGERISREKVEANIVVVEQWDEVQAKIDADIELAQKLQTEEQEQLTDAKK